MNKHLYVCHPLVLSSPMSTLCSCPMQEHCQQLRMLLNEPDSNCWELNYGYFAWSGTAKCQKARKVTFFNYDTTVHFTPPENLLPPLWQGRIKLFGAPRQWKQFRPLVQTVFLSGEGGITLQTESNTTPPSPKTEITNILFYILNFASIIKFKM